MDAIIGRKLGMTQLFAEDGTLTPVTVIEAGPCPVVQVRPAAAQGAAARVQLGFGVKRAKLVPKAQAGHAAKAGLTDTPMLTTMHCLITPDTKIVWDRASSDEIETARAAFNSLRGKGYLAYTVRPGGDRGQVIREFDAQAEKIILAPPMAGG